jgi:hypothetical protein
MSVRELESMLRATGGLLAWPASGQHLSFPDRPHDQSGVARTSDAIDVIEAANLICADSLSQTIDAVDELAFANQPLPSAERERVARWIADRQGLPGAYSGAFAGFPTELHDGLVVFTGERFTHASVRHILGEESCRVLRLLDVRDPKVQAALERADAGLMHSVAHGEHDPRYRNPGVYCCGKCTVSMWRNLASGGLDRHEERLRKGVGQFLRLKRAGQGKWRVFPFWYTVLALTEMDVPEARDELGYVAPVLERTAQRAAPASTHGKRRHELARRALESL